MDLCKEMTTSLIQPLKERKLGKMQLMPATRLTHYHIVPLKIWYLSYIFFSLTSFFAGSIVGLVLIAASHMRGSVFC